MSGSRGRGAVVVFFLLLIAAGPAAADQYHYKDLLIGERAAGLGGAYSAISDDPSGIYYNPAGIVFSMENYFSLSANAYTTTTERYKNILPGQDYTYRSSGLIPLFFGFIQSFGKAKGGFAVIVPNSDVLDQNDTVTGLSAEADRANEFRRRFFRQDITYLLGPAYAREIFKNVTIGFSLLLSIRIDKAIDNQFIVFNPTADDSKQRWYFRNTSLSTTNYALMPKLGIQFMPASKWSVGITASYPFAISSNGQQSVTQTANELDAEGKDTGVIATPNGKYPHDVTNLAGTLKPPLPKVIRFNAGSAYFFSKRFLLSGDVDYYTGDTDYGRYDYPIAATFNWSLGSEYYLTDSLAMRLGTYSNRANTSGLSAQRSDQPTHVNQYGATLGLSFFKPGSSLSLTGAYAVGSGQGQAIGGVLNLQEVTRNSLSVYLTGSYQL